MSPILSFETVKEELKSAIRSSEAALVLGAGASIQSGGPTSADLVRLVKAKFPLAQIPDGATFLAAGTEVCETPPYGRGQLVRYLRETFSPLQPAGDMQQLPRGKWRALFTTNYDDLIQKAYLTPSRMQSLQPVNLPYAGNMLPREGHVPLFYLQGSIGEPEDREGSPVVSRSDYLYTVQLRQAIMDTYRNVIAAGGTVVYLGYSFADELLFDLLDEAARRVGNRNMPYGYAVIPSWGATSASTAARIERRFVTPVEGSFDQFSALIDAVVAEALDPTSRRVMSSPAAGQLLKLKTGDLRLKERDAGVISESFEILTEQSIPTPALAPEEESRLAREFFRGESFGWLPFTNNWALDRDCYEKVFAAIELAAEEGKTDHERIVLVHGPAGLGKSIMVRQLALGLYQQNQFPVIIAKSSWRSRPEITAFDRALADLELDLPEDLSLPPTILLIDEAELLDPSIPHRIARHAQARGRNVVVVLFARTNEFFRAGALRGRQFTEEWSSVTNIAVPETISDAEIEGLIVRLAAIGIWPDKKITDSTFWISYIQKELESSFFESLYQLIDDSKQPLEERVRLEYEHLSDLGKQAYLLIAATHQFGLPLKMEMLVRALGISFADFEQSIIKGDAQSVLFSDYETNELNIFYRGRSRLISGLVFNYAVPEIDDQLKLFRTLLSSASPSSMFGSEETDLVRSLLVQVLGPTGFDNRFSSNQLSTLFAAATEVMEDDVLEHHYGLIERDAGRLESAQTHLENALRLTTELPGKFRESIQNIENSLGQVLGDLAIRALRSGQEGAATDFFEKAGESFIRARAGDFPNAAAYDAHARMLSRRAELFSGTRNAERLMVMSEALEVVSAGIDNVNEEVQAELQELRATILTDLGLGAEAIAELEEVGRSLPQRQRARIEVAIARLLTHGRAGEKNKNLRRALPHATEATELDPKYFDAWRVRGEIYMRLNKSDFSTIADILGRALECDEAYENNWALFELAVAQFYLDRYDLASKTFARLRRASRGNVAGLQVLEKAGERTGDTAFDFQGRITVRSFDGAMVVDSELLRPFGPIWFNPRRQPFYKARLHDSVEFIVGMNYRGLQALELRKL